MSAGTFSAIGNVSASVAIDQDDGLTVTLTNTGGNLWTVVLEESIGNASWRLMATYSSDQSAAVVTPRLARMMIVRLRAANILTGDTIAYTLTRVSNQDGVTLTLEDGVPVDPTLALTSDIPSPILLRASVTLTNAQIKALPVTPVEVVATPGAGYVLVFSHGIVLLNTTAGAYDVNNAAASLTVIWSEGTSREVSNAVDAIESFFEAAGKIQFALIAGDSFVDVDSLVRNDPPGVSRENQALMIADWLSPGSAYTLGHANNTMKVVVYYTVEAVP